MILNLLDPKFGSACVLATAKKVFVSPCSSIRFANSFDVAYSSTYSAQCSIQLVMVIITYEHIIDWHHNWT